jgi:MFS family permease
MVNRFSSRWLLTFFFLCVFIIAIKTGWEWPYIAKLMPVYIAAIPGLILCLVQLYRDITASAESKEEHSAAIDMDEVYEVKLDEKTERRRTVLFFLWFAGGALAVWLLGMVIGLPLLVLLYCLVEGREKWTTSIFMGVCSYAIVWGLFEYMLEMRWPPGALLDR